MLKQQLIENNLELSEMSKRCRRIEHMLETVLEKIGVQSSRGFAIENNLNLPFQELEEFNTFDERLSTDQQFKIDFVSITFSIL